MPLLITTTIFKMLPQLLLLLFFQGILGRDTDWVDPHDMNFDFKEMGMSVLPKVASGHNCNCPVATGSKDISFVYLKRVVSLLMNSATADRDDGNVHRGRYILDLGHENYKFLSDFVNSASPDEGAFRQLDVVLSEVLRRSVAENLHEFLLSTQERIVLLLFSSTSLIFYGLLVGAYITYHLFQAQYSFWSIVRYFIIIMFICDYGIRYRALLEEAEVQNIKVLSPKCKEMGWFDYYFSNKGDCEKKVVTPLDVGLLQVKSMIVIPLSSFGTGMGVFAKELFAHLPFPWNFFIFPAMLIFIGLLLAIVMTTLNGHRFKVNLMHLLHLEFGGSNQSTALDDLLKAMNHRDMIQDVRRTPEKKVRAVTSRRRGRKSDAVAVEKDNGGGGDASDMKGVVVKKSSEDGEGEIKN